MDTRRPKPEPSTIQVITRILGALILAGLLLGGCFALPLVASAVISPWLGVLLAIGAF